MPDAAYFCDTGETARYMMLRASTPMPVTLLLYMEVHDKFFLQHAQQLYARIYRLAAAAFMRAGIY